MTKLLIILFLSVVSISAQTLDSLLSLTMKYNTSLSAWKSRLDGAASKASGVGIYPAPQIMFTVNQIPFSNGNLWDDAFTQEVAISQMFMLGGKLGAMREAELSGLHLIHSQQREHFVKIAQEMTEIYYQLWIMDQEILLQKNYDSLLAKLVGITTSHAGSGGNNVVDILSVRAEQKISSLKLTKMISDREAMVTMLLGKGGFPPGLLSNINPELVPSDTILLADKMPSASNNPSLEVMNSMTNMLAKETIAKEKDIYPDMMVELMLMRMPRGMPITTKTDPAMLHDIGNGMTEYMYGFRLSFTLPFLPGYSSKIQNGVEEKLAQMQVTALEKENMFRMYSFDVRQYQNELTILSGIIGEYQSEVTPLIRQKIRLLHDSYFSGRVDLALLLNEQKMYIMAEMELLNYRKQFLLIKSKLLPYNEFEMISKENHK